MDWRLKKITDCDLSEVVNIHIESLPNDILPSLGINVLNKYYKKVISDETQFIFGAYSGNELLGFCLISNRPVGLFSAVFNVDGLIALLRLALLRPDKFYLGVMQAIKKENINRDAAEISFIAVSPRHQGKSIGRSMITCGTQWCFKKGIKYLQTKTANEWLLDYYIKEYAAEVLSDYYLCGRHYSEVRWAALPRVESECPA